MARHRVPGESSVARLTRPVAAWATRSSRPPAPQHTSRRASRQGTAVRRGRLAALPWLTFVLLLLVVTVGASVLRADSYAATATVSASSDRAASAGAVELTRADLLPRVREAIEMGREPSVRLAVDHPPGRPELLVTARADDPRLAALAADTAAALVVSERQDHLTLSAPATVPSAPERSPSPWWAAAGLTALALALLVERAHGRWELRHTPARPPAEGAW
ncbi:hypothetical protein [Ornithinimicrobium cerasi]|uniref:hypothetical protein n=1 Tax=Ornithinimicrobium cerasi TaxID=2248773 RepID=UPI000F000852|nr:hypothetical protein [Ornithinimicrobium cerasi]